MDPITQLTTVSRQLSDLWHNKQGLCAILLEQIYINDLHRLALKCYFDNDSITCQDAQQ